MISVVTYGRNDNHGTNLQRRAALSLNCIAHVLSAPDDEILFVDYNTPDDLPTFPEAISDTLTARARVLMRILRVRPKIHARYFGQTHLAVIEPVARNAALRRSNPANRWVLSTNTDMIFAPRAGRDLSAVVAGLADGYYHLPRFELPQSLWESLDRREPAEAITRAVEWGEIFGLDAIVRGRHDYFIYDNPGDFQLILRADLWRIGGFDERILLGWHVDANVARRLSLLRGPSGELTRELQAYHCEHTRQVTPKHVFGRPEDDFTTVVEAIERPSIDAEAACFGLAEDVLEEIRLGEAAPYGRALLLAIGKAAPDAGSAAVRPDCQDHDEWARALPFLIDALASYPRDLVLGWFGGRRGLLAGAAAAWRAMGFREPIRVASPAPWLGPELPDGARWCPREDIAATVQVCVLDFGDARTGATADRGPAISPEQVAVIRGLRTLAFAEAERLGHACGTGAPVAPCRVIAVEAAGGRFESLLKTYVGVTFSPIATRIRQGFVLAPQPDKRDILPAMTAGTAGRRDFSTGGIVLIAGQKGFACYGPYLDVLPGRYRVTLEISDGALLSGDSPVRLEILSGDLWLAHRLLAPADFLAGKVELAFSVPPETDETQSTIRIQVRLKTDGLASGTLMHAWLESEPGAPDALALVTEWLPMLEVGVGAWRRTGPDHAQRSVFVRRGATGHVVYGPYASLVPGRYEVEFILAVSRPWRRGPAPIRIEVMAGPRCLAKRDVQPATIGPTVWGLPVIIRPNLVDRDGRMSLEFRLWSDGSLALSVLSVRTRRLTPYAVPKGRARAAPASERRA